MIWTLHGAVGMAADWDWLPEALRSHGCEEEVRSVDLWEFVEGQSCDFEEFGRRLCEMVRAVDDDPLLLGYSMGGRLALHALLEDPAMWRMAFIVSAHPGLADHEQRVMRMATDAEWAGKALVGSWERFLEDWNSQSLFEAKLKSSLPDRRGLESRRAAVARGFIEWSLGKQDDLRPRLEEIQCPILWVTGAQDEKFSALAKEVVQHCFRGTALQVQSAGHRLPWERPQEFARIVSEDLGFWSRVASGEST